MESRYIISSMVQSSQLVSIIFSIHYISIIKVYSFYRQNCMMENQTDLFYIFFMVLTEKLNRYKKGYVKIVY